MDQIEPIEVLLVEDNPADVRLTKEVLKEGRILNNLNVVNDGVEAMECLRRAGRYADMPVQDLVLLDLNLPRMDGREVLAAMREDPELSHIPVIVLTTSSDEADVLSAYSLHANCYITKPVKLDDFVGVLRSIEDFWFTVVRLPSRL
jgi:two-component system, chemotaxis family, response regulator Rcp1